VISLNGRAVKRGRMVNQSQFARAHDTDDFETKTQEGAVAG
jgi:hypothetical protein